MDCDPYYAKFQRCVLDPSEFSDCYRDDKVWNKALILFATLRRSLDLAGNSRMARVAEYHYRIWERKRLYWLWRHAETSGPLPWLRSMFAFILTGYGERPIYVDGWMLMLIALMGEIYQNLFPYVITGDHLTFLDYWFFSFKIFCAKGFTNSYQTSGLLLSQVTEFSIGLVLIALLVGSVTRKLS